MKLYAIYMFASSFNLYLSLHAASHGRYGVATAFLIPTLIGVTIGYNRLIHITSKRDI